MLILSKFHDYYDVMARNGVDKTLVYKRETVETKDIVTLERCRGLHYEEIWHDQKLRMSARRVVVLFCGKAYPLWEGGLYDLRYGHDPQPKNGKVFVRGTKKELLTLIQREFDLGQPSAKPGYKSRFKDTKPKLEERLVSLDIEALHVKYKTPVLLLEVGRGGGYFKQEQEFLVFTNPKLKDYHFESVVDPFTAWQEITMYLGGVIGQPDRPMHQLTDVELRNKHGFDNWSFKKMPST